MARQIESHDSIFNFKERENALLALERALRRTRWAYRKARHLTKKATKATRKAIEAGHYADDSALNALDTFYGSTIPAPADIVEQTPAPAAPVATIPSLSTDDNWARWFKMIDEEIAAEIAAAAEDSDEDSDEE